jgi:hypothetical protein
MEEFLIRSSQLCPAALNNSTYFAAVIASRLGGHAKLAINMVMAGYKPEYAPVVRAAMLALTTNAFNLNGVQGKADSFYYGLSKPRLALRVVL